MFKSSNDNVAVIILNNKKMDGYITLMHRSKGNKMQSEKEILKN